MRAPVQLAHDLICVGLAALLHDPIQSLHSANGHPGDSWKSCRCRIRVWHSRLSRLSWFSDFCCIKPASCRSGSGQRMNHAGHGEGDNDIASRPHLQEMGSRFLVANLVC